MQGWVLGLIYIYIFLIDLGWAGLCVCCNWSEWFFCFCLLICSSGLALMSKAKVGLGTNWAVGFLLGLVGCKRQRGWVAVCFIFNLDRVR